MALNLYTGQPGSGKSYSIVANVIIPALKKGRHVVTNIPLDHELLVEVFGGEITQLLPDCLDDPDLPDHIPHGCVAVIDECWNRWPSGQRVAKAAKNDLHWLKEHRHRVDSNGNAMQVVLATQDPSDLASWVRKLIRHTFWMEKLDTLGADNSFSIKIYKGCPTGENIPTRHLIRQTYGTYDPDVYQYYSSATQSYTTTVGDEKVMDKRTSIWRSPGLIAQFTLSPLIFLIAAYALYWTVTEQIHGDDPVPDSEVVQAAEVVAPVLVNPPPPEPVLVSLGAPVAAPPPAMVNIRPSSLWRVAGYIKTSTEEPDSSWESLDGYGGSGKPLGRLRLQESMAILWSLSGTRYVPLSECDPYSDGINYSCDLDGERVTPWSGNMGLTDTLPGTAVSSVRDVAVERSETATPRTSQPSVTSTNQQPSTSTAASRGSAYTVVEDTSRTPRTLL